MSDDGISTTESYGPQPSRYNSKERGMAEESGMRGQLLGSGGSRGTHDASHTTSNSISKNNSSNTNDHSSFNINHTPPLGNSEADSCAQCAAEEDSDDTDTRTRGNNTGAGPVYSQTPASLSYNPMGSGPQPYPSPGASGSVVAGPAARPRLQQQPPPPQQQQQQPLQQQQPISAAYSSPAVYGAGVAGAQSAAQMYTPVSMSNPSIYNHQQQQQQQQQPQQGQYGPPGPNNAAMPAVGPQYQQSLQQYPPGISPDSSLYGGQTGSQLNGGIPRQETSSGVYYGPGLNGMANANANANGNSNYKAPPNMQSESSGFSYNNSFNTAANTAANAMVTGGGAGGGVNNTSVISSVLPGPYNTTAGGVTGGIGNTQQQHTGYSQSTYAPSVGGTSVYERPGNQTYMTDDMPTTTDRVGTVGKIALGTLAAGAVAYGVHDLVNNHILSDSSEKEKEKRKRQETERLRREAEARRKREEEELRRREEYERWRMEEDNRRRQQEAMNAQYQQQQRPQSQQQQQQYPYQQNPYQQQQQQMQPPQNPYQQQQQMQQQQTYANSQPQRPGSVGSQNSHHSFNSHHSGDGGATFVPPAPFGKPPYSYNPNDVRFPDPTRSSENSETPKTYPELRQNPSDPVIKIGTIVALKHSMTGRFLHSDRSHSTQSGSNQQLVFGYRSNPDENDWWQVLPANRDTPVPGSIVAYGTQIRLRHVETGRHLHSQYKFKDRMGNNEVSAFGDQTISNENDHWVIERWGEGAYGQTWKATDTVVLRHYVSGMALHSHDVMTGDDTQSVVCTGIGSSENARWKPMLTK